MAILIFWYLILAVKHTYNQRPYSSQKDRPLPIVDAYSILNEE